MSKLDNYTDHDIDSLHKKLACAIWLAEFYNQQAIYAMGIAGLDAEHVKKVAKANMQPDEDTHKYTEVARELGAPETEPYDE
jgi:hypothetical protein